MPTGFFASEGAGAFGLLDFPSPQMAACLKITIGQKWVSILLMKEVWN